MIYSIELSQPAEESLAYILNDTRKIGIKIIGQLKNRLPYDPLPDIDNERDLFHSEIVKSLENEGFEVYRLKSREFYDYRVFYIVDDDVQKIYVLEIVERTNKTYDLFTPHMQRIRNLYIQYYLSKQEGIQ